MSINYESDLLGKMTLIEAYEYYDEPILFSCRSLTNQIYMSVWAKKEEIYDKWMYVALSPERFAKVREGVIQIQKVFSEPESNIICILNCDKETKTSKTTFVKPSEIPKQWFPIANDYLEIDNQTSDLEVDELNKVSKVSGRSTMRVHLSAAGSDHSEAPADLAWKFIEGIQDSAYAFGQANSGTLGKKGRYSSAVKEDVRLYVKPFYGSFGLEISVRKPAREKNNELIDDFFFLFTSLINCGSNTKQLNSKLSQLPDRAVEKYISLVEVIASYDARLELSWASSTGIENGKAEITSQTAREAVNSMRQIRDKRELILLIVGKIEAINLKSGYFAIRDVRDGERYSGYILESGMEYAKNITMNKEYNATIRQIVEIDDTTSTEKYHYSLQKIEPLRS